MPVSKDAPEVLADMLKELCGTATYMELSKATGWGQRRVAAWLTALRQRALVRIVSWDGDAVGNPTIPRFEFAPGQPDSKRPAATPAERMAAMRERRGV